MANELGALHTLGFKPQTTPGSAESTVNTFLCTESISVNKNPKHIERKSHIGVGRLLPSRLGWFAPDGSATTEVMASQPHPWYWALGAVSSSRPAASTDPTVYLHTITVADTGPVNLTCEADRVFDHVKQADAKINKLKLAVKPGEVGTLEIEWLALDHTDGATLTSTPVFVTDVLTCRAVVIEVDDGVLATITDAEIEWDGMLKAPPTLQDGTGKPYVRRRRRCPASSASSTTRPRSSRSSRARPASSSKCCSRATPSPTPTTSSSRSRSRRANTRAASRRPSPPRLSRARPTSRRTTTP
jgi:hypothetical protein